MNHKIFENYLTTVDLKKYREQYQPIKLVEMDMPRNIQALDAIYEIYWTKQTLLTFEDFYEYYKSSCASDIEAFRLKTTMCVDCFYRGLPARIYRTWASIITQIHAGYVASDVYSGGSVEMSTDLDHAGIDFAVHYKNHIINYQVKKSTHSREVRVSKRANNQDIEIILIEYEVPAGNIFAEPFKQDGTYKLPYKRFIENKNLKRLSNGFVIFTPNMFLSKRDSIN